MGRPSNTEERRQQIMDAFQTLLAERGYDGATIQEVAQRAGLRPGLVHYHFQNKLEIMTCLVERMLQRVEQRYARRLACSAGDPLSKLWAFLDAHLELGPDADPSAVAAWVVVGAEALSEPELNQLYRAAIDQRLAELKRLFMGVLHGCGRQPRAAREMAAAVAAMIEGTFQLASLNPEALPRGFATKTLRSMVLGLLEAES